MSTELPRRQVTIRERTPSDLPALADAICAVYADSGYPVQGVSDPIGLLSCDQQLISFVALVDGQIVGQVSLRATADPGQPVELGRLFVHPDAAGVGAGRALLTAAMAHATKTSCRLELEVLAKDQIAERLYQQAGWVQVRTGERTAQGKTHQARYYQWPPAATGTA